MPTSIPVYLVCGTWAVASPACFVVRCNLHDGGGTPGTAPTTPAHPSQRTSNAVATQRVLHCQVVCHMACGGEHAVHAPQQTRNTAFPMQLGPDNTLQPVATIPFPVHTMRTVHRMTCYTACSALLPARNVRYARTGGRSGECSMAFRFAPCRLTWRRSLVSTAAAASAQT